MPSPYAVENLNRLGEFTAATVQTSDAIAIAIALCITTKYGDMKEII